MSNPVPILLFNRALGFGGSERQLTEAALHLDRSLFEPHVGCIRLEGERLPELQRAGVPVAEFRFPSFGSPRILSAAVRLANYMRRHRIQLVHTFDGPGTMFAVPVGYACGIPVVLSSQRAFRELKPGLSQRLLRITDRLVDGIVVNSENLRQHLHKQGLDPALTTLIYNSVDLETFVPGPRVRDILPQCPVVIGTTSRLRPEKGVDTLVEAFLSLAQRDPRVGLLLVGEGPLQGRIEARIRESGAAGRCHLVGGAVDVSPWLRRMDIFVLPSLSEALSNSLLEAMASGCAAVASSVGGNPELVRNGDTGLLFPPGDAAELERKLTQLLHDEPLRNRLAESGSTFIRENFSRARSLQALNRLYLDRLAAARGRV